MSTDQFFLKRFDKSKYNCAHFVADVWMHETGEDITKPLAGFLLPPNDRRANVSIRKSFTKIKAPQEPCIVLMQRSRSTPHVGIFLRGKVFHIQEKGAEFLPLKIAMRGFNKVSFYKCLSE